MKLSKIREAIKEVLEETSMSGGAGGYMSPKAFSRQKIKIKK
jgi:hypothetical protein